MLQKTRDEFALRFFRWAIGDARREVGEGLRLIRSIKGASALRAAAYLGRLSPSEQVEVLEALTKRFHPRASAASDALTARQVALIEKKDLAMREMVPPEVSRQSTQEGAPMSTSRLKTLAKRHLASLGEIVPLTSRVSQYDQRVGPWTVHTMVNVGSPCYYVQYIRAAGAAPLQESISVLAWLGVTAQTTWDLARAGDEEQTVEAIVNACSHFLAAAPALLEGIEPL